MKKYLLDRLYEKRAADQLKDFPDGYKQVGDFHGGVFDRKRHISPWSMSSKNTDSSVMLLGQDWSSEKHLSQPIEKNIFTKDLGYDPRLQSNKNLHRHLKASFNLTFKDVYASNVFVFIKPGGMSSRIPNKLMDYSAKTYAIPEIEIVRPRIVICLGALTFRCLKRNCDTMKSFTDSPMSVENPHFTLQRTMFVHAPHPGSWGTKNAGGPLKVSKTWMEFPKMLRSFLAALQN
jgi:uracil-DNA glycosylase